MGPAERGCGDYTSDKGGTCRPRCISGEPELLAGAQLRLAALVALGRVDGLADALGIVAEEALGGLREAATLDGGAAALTGDTAMVAGTVEKLPAKSFTHFMTFKRFKVPAP